MHRPLILMIGQDESGADIVDNCLVGAGCDVTRVSSEPTARELMDSEKPDVIVLSSSKHDDTALQMCRSIAARYGNEAAPVLVFAPPARDVREGGHRPDPGGRLMDLSEFAAGIAVLACSASEEHLQATRVSTCGLHLDRRAFQASVDGRELKLTLTEFNILWLLARRAGDVLTRHELCGECGDADPNGRCRSVDVHIRSLRCKLDDRSDLIETVRRAGYRLHGNVGKQTRQTAVHASGH